MTIKIKKKGEFLVNGQTGLGDQITSSAATLKNGTVVVVWEDQYANPTLGGDASGTSIKMTILKANGKVAQATALVNTTETGDQSAPRVIGLDNGDFIVAWTHEDGATGDGSNSAVHMQRFDKDGNKILGELQVNTVDTNGNQNQVDLVQMTGSEFAFVWSSAATGDMDIRINKLTALIPISVGFGSEATVNASTGNNQFGSRIAETTNGNIMVVWASSDLSRIHYRVVDSDFQTVKNESIANDDETDGSQSQPIVKTLKNGNFVVAWSSSGAEDGDGNSVLFRLFDQSGTAIGSTSVLNNIGANSQSDVDITALDDGRFLVTWESDSGGASGVDIKGRIFKANGDAYGNEFLINANGVAAQTDSVVTAMKNGKVMVTWTTADGTGGGGDGNGTAVKGRVLDVGSVRDGNGGKNKITGDAGRDEINGKGGNDTIKGLGGNDVLKGGGGKDKIFVGKGVDKAIGGAGKDQFVFAKKDGKKNTVDDFDNGQDKLNLKALGYNNKTQALAEFTDAGGANNNKVIFNDKGTKVVIKGIDLDQLGASDILI